MAVRLWPRGIRGGTNWWSPSFSPVTGLFYIPSFADRKNTYIRLAATYVEGAKYEGGTPRPTADVGYGAIRAIDPATGALKWEFKMTGQTRSGVVTTASNVLFTGGREGDFNFHALDATTGAPLWRWTIGGTTNMGPMTYAAGGRQYVAVASGSELFAFALPQ
jgi:alcohol dehydrogenase (cytochrome c)